MRVELRSRLDDGLLDELRVPSTPVYSGELERIQLAQLGHGSTTYVVARDGQGRAAGLTPVYTTRPPWHPSTDPAALPPADAATLALAGSYGVYSNYLSIGASVPGAEAPRVAATLVEQARALAREAGCGHVVFPYLDPTQAAWLAPYRAAAAAVSVREKAVLGIEWKTFDEYVSWLPTRRRTPVRRQRRRLAESGLVIRERPVVQVAGELAPLLAQTNQRYGQDADPQRIEFHYTLLGTHLRDDFVALVAYQDGRPVACSLLLACGNRWISKAWGCDYTRADHRFLYFNLVFYEPISRAVERGFALLDYGIGGLESKLERGCTVQELRTMLIASDGAAPVGSDAAVPAGSDAAIGKGGHDG